MPYRVEGTRGQICELLRLSPRPLKAKEIAAALSTASSMALSKRDVNPILYELQKYGVASRDSEYRWSVKPEAVDRGTAPDQFIWTIDPEERRRIRELGPRSVFAPIGHWIFTLGRELATDREVWRIECAICGFQTGCRVQSHQQVYPLTGNLRDRRRRHDRMVHPQEAKAQILIEKRLVGYPFQATK